jgi:hypothetical protein
MTKRKPPYKPAGKPPAKGASKPPPSGGSLPAAVVSFSFGAIEETDFGAMHRMPVTIKVSENKNPLSDLLIELDAGPDDVIDPAPRLGTNAKGEATFYITFPPQTNSVDLLAIVTFLNGQFRKYSDRWHRRGHVPATQLEHIRVEKKGVHEGISSCTIQYGPNAKMEILAQRDIAWCYGSAKDVPYPKSELIELNHNGEADILIASCDGEGMMISFQCDEHVTDPSWLPGKARRKLEPKLK